MDLTPVLDGVAVLVQQNPKTAGALSLLAILPYVAAIGERATRRTHSTWLNSILGAVARWPGPKAR